MSTTTAKDTYTVALVGNPNTGKSTLFSALAGVRQRVGNYPGVTVEKKVGHARWEGRRFALVDLPGTYSLAPRSPDEMVAVDVLLGRQGDVPPPDAVVCILDATNLERNLYLVSQVLELRLPTVVALNMTDLARQQEIVIDAAQLERRLGVPVVPIQAHRRVGLEQLKVRLASAVDQAPAERESCFPEPFRREVARLEAGFAQQAHRPPRYLVERLLLDTSGYLERMLLADGHAGAGDRGAAQTPAPMVGESPCGIAREQLSEARARLAEAGLPVPAVEAMARYAWAADMLAGVVSRPAQRAATAGDGIDRVLTHPIVGLLVFAALMLVVFLSVFWWADYPMGWIDAGVAATQQAIENSMAIGPLRSLLADGIVGGVGMVIVFLPQIVVLFLFIAILEDCGYMARAAYLMDKLMSCVGLSGKSFIPLLSSFACAIPGIMAARVIEDRRDRLATILIAPLMSCSARLPVYTLLIAMFLPAAGLTGAVYKGAVLFAMYALGIVVAAAMAWLLKRTLLRGETPPFVMELPSYKWPSPRTVVLRIADRCWGFVKRAGTIILAVSVVVWALLYFPELSKIRSPEELEDPLLLAEAQRNSYLGMAGRTIEPAVAPLGWDWRIGAAALASFPAREVVIATLGVIFNQGAVEADDEEARTGLREALAAATWEGTGRPLVTTPVALSIMVFFALCAQCAATLAVIRRETNSWRWPAFTFVYMTALAYVGALITYQVGSRLI